MVGWQAISRSEDCWLFSVQLRRGTTRRLSANQNTESHTADSIPIQVGAAKVKDVPKTIRSLCQGAALYHSKTARNVSGDADVACKREAVSGGNDDITIKRELDADP